MISRRDKPEIAYYALPDILYQRRVGGQLRTVKKFVWPVIEDEGFTDQDDREKILENYKKTTRKLFKRVRECKKRKYELIGLQIRSP